MPLEEVVRLNGIADPDRIEVGRRLLIPGDSRPSAASEPAPLIHYRRELELAEQQLTAADFSGAGARVERLRGEISPTEQGAPQILVRLEQVSAHVHVALGRPELATAAFARALRIDPGYAPPAASPPKLLRAFQAAATGAGIP